MTTTTIHTPVANHWGLPNLGYGVGLRTVHFSHVLQEHPPVDWFEIISENFLNTGGRVMHVLDQVAERYPIAMHGVSMSIGSTDPLDVPYLKKLKELSERINARWVSDHICWTGVAHRNMHDLLPVPYNQEVVDHMVARIKQAQDIMERPLMFENPSTYVEFTISDMTEWDFIREVCDQSGCGLLLDANNIYVSCFNHGWDADEYLAGIPHDRVTQYHLAGHTNRGTHIIDTHDNYVIDEVWQIYRKCIQRSGGRATLLEWDDNIPEFDIVHAESLKARDLVADLVVDSAASSGKATR